MNYSTISTYIYVYGVCLCIWLKLAISKHDGGYHSYISHGVWKSRKEVEAAGKLGIMYKKTGINVTIFYILNMLWW